MLHEEFSALMGRKCTEEEYVQANAVYMQVEMNKENFCREWKKVGDSVLVKELSEENDFLYQRMISYSKRYKKFRKALEMSPCIDEIIIRTVSDGVTSWACVNPNKCVFEYMADEEDDETYVSGCFSLDNGDFEGVYISEEFHGTLSVTDYDGVYELPKLVRRAFDLLGYDTSGL